MKALRVVAVAIGLASSMAQFTILREFLGVLGGNELIIGLVMGMWLLFSGLGAAVAGKLRMHSRNALGWSIFLSIITLPASVLGARVLVPMLVMRGAMAGIGEILAAAALSMGAYCILVGAQMALVLTLLNESRAGGVGLGYALDSAGGAVGGVLFAAFLVGLNPFVLTLCVISANIASLIFLRTRPMLIIASLAIALMLLCTQSELQKSTNRMQYPGQKILAQEYSRYGNLVVTESFGQMNIFQDGAPLFSTNNAIAAEETVHYAMVQLAHPRKVLLIGGGPSGTLKELLKYPSLDVDYVEIDPQLVRLSRAYLPDSGLDEPGVHLIDSDGRLYLKQNEKKYDVIIVDLPEPSSAQLNRFYTQDFFRQVKASLSSDGVFSTKLAATNDYVGQDAGSLNRAVYGSLSKVFRNVLALPAGSNVYLASDADLSWDIGRLVRARNVSTDFVNDHYTPAVLTRQRIDNLRNAIGGMSQENTDDHPLAYLQYLNYWISHFSMWPPLRYILLLVFIASLALYLGLKPQSANLMGAGFSATTIQLVILLSFQSAFGFVYPAIGALTAAFMCGLVVGAYFASAIKSPHRRLHTVCALLGGYCLAVPFIIRALANATAWASAWHYAFLAFLLGALIGGTFSLSARLREKTPDAKWAPGHLLGVDYLGSFLGSLLAAGYLIPALGLINVCILTGLLNAISLLRLTFESKND
jgi:spermidine synthase